MIEIMANILAYGAIAWFILMAIVVAVSYIAWMMGPLFGGAVALLVLFIIWKVVLERGYDFKGIFGKLVPQALPGVIGLAVYYIFEIYNLSWAGLIRIIPYLLHLFPCLIIICGLFVVGKNKKVGRFLIIFGLILQGIAGLLIIFNNCAISCTNIRKPTPFVVTLKIIETLSKSSAEILFITMGFFGLNLINKNTKPLLNIFAVITALAYLIHMVEAGVYSAELDNFAIATYQIIGLIIILYCLREVFKEDDYKPANGLMETIEKSFDASVKIQLIPSFVLSVAFFFLFVL